MGNCESTSEGISNPSFSVYVRVLEKCMLASVYVCLYVPVRVCLCMCYLGS